MCWSAEVSMNTWLLVVFAAVVALYNKYHSIWSSLFFLSFGSVQLLEYFLWTYLKNPGMNALLSKIGLGLVTVQPLFSILQLNSTAYLKPMLLLYSLFAAFSAYIGLNPKQFGIEFSTTVASNGHLLWKWVPDNKLYLVSYILLLLTPLYLLGYSVNLIGSILALVATLYTYYTSGTWGSMWCWIAALFSFHILAKTIMMPTTCK